MMCASSASLSNGRLWDDGITVSRHLVTGYDSADDPLTLTSVRDDHLRVTNGSREDDYIQTLIAVSLRMAQRRTQRRILPETWQLQLSAFPWGVIQVPFPPLIEVVSVTYIDADDAEQSLTVNDDYVVEAPSGPEAVRGAIRLAADASWPSTATRPDAVRVTFRSGYVSPGVSPETVDVPADISHARLLVIKDLYENRGISFVGPGNVVSKAEITANDIWDSYRDRTVAG